MFMLPFVNLYKVSPLQWSLNNNVGFMIIGISSFKVSKLGRWIPSVWN